MCSIVDYGDRGLNHYAKSASTLVIREVLMAKYRITKSRTGKYAITGSLSYGKDVMYSEAKAGLEKGEVVPLIVQMAERIAIKRLAVETIRGGAGIPGVGQ
jgi:hypothetical protein